MDSKTGEFFGQSQAAIYDKHWEKLSPMPFGLHFLTQILLKDLPEDAHLLCVGVGTGSELMMLSKAFPQARFTAVEPSGPMLEMCKIKVEAAGFTSRCTFHEGYLESLPGLEKFDAATAILVSHFLVNPIERSQFFQEISKRLKAGSYLINADIASPRTSEMYDSLALTWIKAMLFAGIPEDKAQLSMSAWGKQLTVSKPEEIESLLCASGFESPTLFYQALFIHGWYSTKR